MSGSVLQDPWNLIRLLTTLRVQYPHRVRHSSLCFPCPAALSCLADSLCKGFLMLSLPRETPWGCCDLLIPTPPRLQFTSPEIPYRCFLLARHSP